VETLPVTSSLPIAFLLALAPVTPMAPPGGGTVEIESRSAGGDYDPALAAFVDATAAALADKGFTILNDPGHAAFVAELVLGREEVGTGLARVAGQRTPSMAGAGVSVPLSTGRSDLVPLDRTRLELVLHRRGQAAVLWRGAAVTVRATGPGKGAEAAVAADLARAVVNPYPAQAPGVVGVP
jgi:hypothetical protein